MAEQTVSMRLGLDASELKKELADSGKAADQLAGDVQGMGAKIDRALSGITDSASKVEDGIRGLDARMDTLTGADRQVFIRANIGQAEAGIRQIDRMLTDPTLTDTEIRIAMDRRNEASRAIEDLKEQLDELGPAAAEAGQDMERGLNVGALAGAAGSAGVAGRLDEAVTSAGRLRAQLGLTGDEAREFDAIAKEVYRDNFGDSMGQASQAVGMVHQSLGLTGDALRDTTEGVFAIADAFGHVGADVPIILEDVRAMKANFPDVTDAQALDLIADAFQSGAGNAGDLQDTLQEYPGDFARLGLTADDMLGLLNVGMENGIRNTDIMADAVREMGIRISTAGDTGQEALAKLFPEAEADRLIRDITAGGEAGRDAFFTILDGLTAVQDPQERYNLAIEIMGTRGEEIANQLPGMRDALLGVRDGTADASGATESLNEQYDGFRNTLDGITRTLETSVLGGLGDVGTGLADVASNVGIAVLGFQGLKGMFPGMSLNLRNIGRAAGMAGAAGGLLLLGTMLADARHEADLFARQVAGGFTDPRKQLANVREEIERLQHVAGRGVRLDLPADISIFSSNEAKEAENRLDALRAMAAELELEISNASDAASGEFSEGMLAIHGGALGARDAMDEAASSTSDFGGAIEEDALTPLEQLDEAIRAVNDALHAQFDPLFAAQDALLANAEAQDRVKRAELELLAAQDALNKATAEHGPESDQAREAAMRLLGAHQALDDANRDATRSAMDVTTATNELAAKMRDGQVDILGAEEQLRKWVDQGLITEQQAWETSQQLRGVGDRAAELEGRNIQIPVGADTSSFERAMADLYGGWGSVPGIRISVGGGGGLTLDTGGVVDAPVGTPVPATVHGGEFVIKADAAQAIGYDALHAMNRGEPAQTYMAAPAPAGGGIDYNRLASAVGGGRGGANITIERGDQLDPASVAAVFAWAVA